MRRAVLCWCRPLLQSTIPTPTRRQPVPAPDRFSVVVANGFQGQTAARENAIQIRTAFLPRTPRSFGPARAITTSGLRPADAGITSSFEFCENGANGVSWQPAGVCAIPHRLAHLAQ